MRNSPKQKSSPSKKRQPKIKIETGSVLDYWESQAKAHGSSDLATNPDTHYRKLELDSIKRVIKSLKHDTVLDVGCGNGYGTLDIAREFPAAMVTGVDFSEAMIKEARRSITPNTEFYDGDVLSLSRNKQLVGQQFDVVLSSRCLINLSNFEEQKVGILEMRKLLVPDGRLILVENVQDGLDNLNDIRGKLGLPAIKAPWHNKYLPQGDVRKFFGEIQGHLLTAEYVENIGNFYYMASRVLYAKLCMDQGVEPDYNNPINAIASQLPTMGEYYACSPNFMFVLKNEAGTWDKKLSS